MKPKTALATILGTVAVGMFGISAAQQPADFGKHEYDSKCSACHGETGEGNGIEVFVLESRPANLSALSKKNNGTFPFVQTYQALDGRYLKAYSLHQSMPAWGNIYMMSAVDQELAPHDAEAYVRDRVLALVEHVYGLQSK